MMKIVYVLVGTEKIEYINMLRVSVASARAHMNAIDIIVLTDQESYVLLKSDAWLIGNNVNIISVNMPFEYNTVEKSRYLKTNMRSLVEGDFLYLDSDTIICDDISDTVPKYSVSLVLDENRLLFEQDDKGESIKARARERAYNLDNCERYYNGGVILVKDDETAHLFFKRWFEEWDKTRKPGMYQDQFSLNYVNSELGVIHELDGTWNCQVTASYQGLGYLRNVKILHYLSAQPAGVYQLNDISVLSGNMEEKTIQQIIRHPERAFRKSHLFADDSLEYQLMHTSHYRFIERVYTRHRRLFIFSEKVLNLFRK